MLRGRATQWNSTQLSKRMVMTGVMMNDGGDDDDSDEDDGDSDPDGEEDGEDGNSLYVPMCERN